jgi:hypothetical protein
LSEDELIPVFMPSLVSVLVRSERDKGSPLTEEEVLAIRDKSAVVMMRRRHAVEMAEKRGYDDIDPTQCWSEWQRVRVELL